MRGDLIVLEGPDEVGKSTVSQALVEELSTRGGRVEYLSFPGREPGTPGDLVYRLHHEPASLGVSAPTASSMQIFHVAAHADMIEKQIRPLLTRGIHIVLDRYWWSMAVYGEAYGLDKGVLGRLIGLERELWSGISPQEIFLVDTPEPRATVADLEVWYRIRKLYSELAVLEREQGQNVTRVSNVGRIEDAVEVIMGSLLQSGNEAYEIERDKAPNSRARP